MLRSSQISASVAQAAGAASFEALSVATLRDILADLRVQDAAEIVATLPGHIRYPEVAEHMVHASLLGAVMRHQGYPAAAIGVVENWPGVWEGWSWGTTAYSLCQAAMAEWCRSVIMPALAERKIHRLHVKAMASHGDAHRWIEWLGLAREADHPGYGRFGETFTTFAWTSPHLRVRAH